MFRNTRNIRNTSLSLVVLAGLVATTGSDCDDSTGGMFDLDLNSTSTSGPIFDAINDNAGPIPELAVGASKSSFNPGDTIGFGASVRGGQAPYYYFWMRSDQAGWTQGGTNWSTVADFPSGQSRTVYAQVIDSNGIESNLVELTLTNGSQEKTGCDSIHGNTWMLSDGFFAYFKVNGDKVTGAVFGPGVALPVHNIEGTLTRGEGACSDCTVLTGTWIQSLASWTDNPATGNIRYVFEPDNMSFIGRWSRAGESHWAGNWNGSRSDCTFNTAK